MNPSQPGGNPSPIAPPPGPAIQPAGPPGLPQVNMASSQEVQAWIRRLEAEEKKLARQTSYFTVALVGAGMFLLVSVISVYRATIGAYAVIEEIEFRQHPAQPGRLHLGYRVVSPGKVHCRRVSGEMVTELIDRFRAPCKVERPWSWSYLPGDEILLTIWHRRGFTLRSIQQSFPTSDRVDIVILLDTTGSMGPSIALLQEKCVTFASNLAQQSLRPRFALLGFGDTHDGEWLDNRGFTDDVRQFRQWVESLRRFDGGLNEGESALDALEEALRLQFGETACRYFYLVTDETYHDPTHAGTPAAEIARQLAEKRVILHVFSRRRWAVAYAKLLGELGRFDDVENFGRLLSEGRILED
jgi:hypothetical protein